MAPGYSTYQGEELGLVGSFLIAFSDNQILDEIMQYLLELQKIRYQP
jgi:hypothetical protein